MLKINLLPAHIRQRRLVKRAIAGVIVAVLVTIGGFLYWNFTPNSRHRPCSSRSTS